MYGRKDEEDGEWNEGDECSTVLGTASALAAEGVANVFTSTLDVFNGEEGGGIEFPGTAPVSAAEGVVSASTFIPNAFSSEVTAAN